MTPDYTGIWKVLYDWQTIITGILALIAGAAALGAALKQAKAATEANRHAKAEAAKNPAIVKLSAARLLDGALRRLAEDVAAAATHLSQFAEGDPMIRGSLEGITLPELSVVWASIGLFVSETVAEYVSLDADVRQIKANGVSGCGHFQQQLPIILERTQYVRELIVSEGKRASDLLAAHAKNP